MKQLHMGQIRLNCLLLLLFLAFVCLGVSITYAADDALLTSQSKNDLTITQTINNDNPEVLETIEFNIIVTDTMLSTPVITVTLPDGLTLNSFTNNNIFQPTQMIDGRAIVWQPRVDPALAPLNYPARLTVFATVNSDAADDYRLMITTTDVAIIQAPSDQPSSQVDTAASDTPLNVTVNTIEATSIPSLITLIFVLTFSTLTMVAYRCGGSEDTDF